MASIVGTTGDDVLSVGTGKNSVDGKAGDDLLIVDFSHVVGNVSTIHSGGLISNNLDSDDPNYTLLGVSNIERMNITSSDGNDDFYTFGGDDTVSSGGGDDVINTRAGHAVVDGGAGTDIWTAILSAYDVGGSLDLARPGAQAFYDGKVKGIESVNLTLGAGNDTVLTLTGKAGFDLDDTVIGGAGSDTARFGGGKDYFNGGDGDDLVIVDFSKAKGAIDTFNSGGVVTNHLTGADEFSMYLSGVERVDFTGSRGDDEFYLFAGDDTVHAGAGDDVINTRAGRAVVDGGKGDDIWTADLSASTLSGTLDLGAKGPQAFLGGSVEAVESVRLTLGSGNDTVTTLLGRDGRGHDDAVLGGAGDDVVTFGGGQDTFGGGDGEDLLIVDFSKAKGDITTSHSGAIISNNLDGQDEFTVYQGGAEHIDVRGGRGDDQLYTQGGTDTLTGGLGADTLAGNAGADTFVYGALADSKIKAADLINGLANEDRIDLSAIDANAAKAGNQAFRLVGAFDGHAGQLMVSYSSETHQTSIEADVDGDGKADMRILAAGDHHDFSNFVL